MASTVMQCCEEREREGEMKRGAALGSGYTTSGSPQNYKREFLQNGELSNFAFFALKFRSSPSILVSSSPFWYF
jgi:hypothetical protein